MINEMFREEKKYLLSLAEGKNFAQRLTMVMAEDAHNAGEGYRIRSLYFDTVSDSDYFDKVDGLEQRRKIRLRIYDPNGDFAMLEMKQKEGPYQRKRSLRLTREEGEQLINGNYDPLLLHSEAFAAECYGLMNRLCYRPKAIVEYKRRAFIAKENHIRVTLDSQITATEASLDLFDPDLLQYPVLDPFHTILEVKYNGFLLSYLKTLLSDADRLSYSVSKYCLARKAGLQY